VNKAASPFLANCDLLYHADTKYAWAYSAGEHVEHDPNHYTADGSTNGSGGSGDRGWGEGREGN
jgi:hypothetical protein